MNITQNLKDKVKERVLDLFEKAHLNDDLCNINIQEHITNKLLPYQLLHTFNMITALNNNNVIIDGSYTGTGKTYTTIAVCAQLNLIPFIICPKSIMCTWRNVLKYFNMEYVTVVNYESIRSLKYIDSTNNKVDCPYIKKVNVGNTSYAWDFNSHPKSNKIVIIFDEVHKCKNYKSFNGKLLLSCQSININNNNYNNYNNKYDKYNNKHFISNSRNNKNNKIKIIMLSATLCDKNYDFGIFGQMLGFYNNYRQGKDWLESIMREDKNQYGKNKINTLHKYLFPDKGSKMSIEDLDDSFPMNQISIDCYTLSSNNLKAINEYYDKIHNNCESNDTNKLMEINIMRQKIENIKVDLIIDLMLNYYEQNKSVVIFINYISTFNKITSYLMKKEIQYAEINGKQDHEERQQNIDIFQNNGVRIIVCMVQAGGTSISLHDINGRFPRVSIVSPSYSRIELMQALGRIYRSGVKSPCLQRIVYCADTCEETIANTLRKKQKILDKITDEDLFIQKRFINEYDIDNDTDNRSDIDDNIDSENNN